MTLLVGLHSERAYKAVGDIEKLPLSSTLCTFDDDDTIFTLQHHHDQYGQVFFCARRVQCWQAAYAEADCDSH